MPAAASGKKANFFRRQRHKVLVGSLNVFKRVAAENLLNTIRRRIRVVHQVNFRLGGTIAGEGIMQQIIQHLAILPRPTCVVVSGMLQWRVVPRASVPHANRHFCKLSPSVVRQHVRFQIEHDLQPMFELAQQVVIVFELVALVGSERAGFFEPGNCIERVARANFGNGVAI